MKRVLRQIIFFLAAVLIGLSAFALSAFAQVPVVEVTPRLTSIVVNTQQTVHDLESLIHPDLHNEIYPQLQLLNKDVGIPGQTPTSVADSSSAACSVAQAADNIDSISPNLTNYNFTDFTSIAGSKAESALLSRQLVTAIALQQCLTAQQAALKATPIQNVIQGQDIQRKMSVLDNKITEIGQRIEDLKAKQSQSFQQVLKTIAQKLIVSDLTRLSTRLINLLVQKYRISDFLKYADAVSNQIYTSEYITRNFADSGDQLVLRSILQNPGFQGIVRPIVKQKADAQLASVLGVSTVAQVDVTNPDFYGMLAQVGNGSANPVYMQEVAVQNSVQSRAAGDSGAQSEINTSQGFIPLRDCSAPVAQQQAIDNQNLQLSNAVHAAQDAVNQEQAAYDIAQTSAAQAALNTANAALITAQNNLRNLPQSTPTPILDMCNTKGPANPTGGITNPSSFLADGIQNYLKYQLDQGSNVAMDNLPFYGRFIFSVADNFLNGILQSGLNYSKLLTSSDPCPSNPVTCYKVTPILASDYTKGATATQLLNQAQDQVQAEQQPVFGNYLSSAPGAPGEAVAPPPSPEPSPTPSPGPSPSPNPSPSPSPSPNPSPPPSPEPSPTPSPGPSPSPNPSPPGSILDMTEQQLLAYLSSLNVPNPSPQQQAAANAASTLYYAKFYNNKPSTIAAQQSGAYKGATASSFAGSRPLTDSTGAQIGTVNHIGTVVYVTLTDGTNAQFNSQQDLQTYIAQHPQSAGALSVVNQNYLQITQGVYNPPTVPANIASVRGASAARPNEAVRGSPDIYQLR